VLRVDGIREEEDAAERENQPTYDLRCSREGEPTNVRLKIA
jgi:hypothetical protein